jgi:hypothetical protein
MATQLTEVTQKPKGPREVRSFGVRLVGDKDELLHLVAHKTKTGWRTEAVHHLGKGKRSRGATQQHATIDQARAAVEKLASAAEKAGWKRKTGRSFERVPDAFGLDALPKPGMSAKK